MVNIKRLIQIQPFVFHIACTGQYQGITISALSLFFKIVYVHIFDFLRIDSKCQKSFTGEFGYHY